MDNEKIMNKKAVQLKDNEIAGISGGIVWGQASINCFCPMCKKNVSCHLRSGNTMVCVKGHVFSAIK